MSVNFNEIAYIMDDAGVGLVKEQNENPLTNEIANIKHKMASDGFKKKAVTLYLFDSLGFNSVYLLILYQ